MRLKPVASDGADAGLRQQETLRADGRHLPHWVSAPFSPAPLVGMDRQVGPVGLSPTATGPGEYRQERATVIRQRGH